MEIVMHTHSLVPKTTTKTTVAKITAEHIMAMISRLSYDDVDRIWSRALQELKERDLKINGGAR